MPPDARPPRRTFALIPAAILVLATLNLNIPYFSLEPGPTRDVGPLIRVEGREDADAPGELLLTTVSLRELKVADALRGFVLADVDVVRRSVIIPPGRTEEEIDRFNTQQMQESQLFATVAALDLLGYQLDLSGVGVEVESILPDVPAGARLRPGDLIVGTGDEPLCGGRELVERVGRRMVGEAIDLRVLRDGEPVDLSVETVPDPEDEDRPIIGIEISPAEGEVRFPVEVDIVSEGIGGPSAGLLFAVGIYEELHDGDLIGDRTVAGTGTISCDGEVGAVGGLRQKLAAAAREDADVFLVPEDELEVACREGRAFRVIGVADLADAVAALRDASVARSRSCSPAQEAAG